LKEQQHEIVDCLCIIDAPVNNNKHRTSITLNLRAAWLDHAINNGKFLYGVWTFFNKKHWWKSFSVCIWYWW